MVTQDPLHGRGRTGGAAQSSDMERTQPFSTSGTGGSTGTGEGMAEKVQQQAGQVKEQVGQKAGEVKDQVVEQATSRVEQGKDQATSSLGLMAGAIRQTSGQLRSQDQDAIAQYVDRAAEQVENLSDYLSKRSVTELIGDVERFARREPTLFLGGAFLLGLVGARFLKSSGQSSQGYSGGQNYSYQGYTGSTYGGTMQSPSYSSYALPSQATPPAMGMTGQGALHDAGMAGRPMDLGQATGGAGRMGSSQYSPPTSGTTRPAGASTGMASGTSAAGTGGSTGLPVGMPTSGGPGANDDVIVGGPPITDAIVGGPPIERSSSDRLRGTGEQGRERS